MTSSELLFDRNTPWIAAKVEQPDPDADTVFRGQCAGCQDRTERRFCCLERAKTLGWSAYVRNHVGCALRMLDPEQR
jgi:hypothetical protein